MKIGAEIEHVANKTFWQVFLVIHALHSVTVYQHWKPDCVVAADDRQCTPTVENKPAVMTAHTLRFFS